jgi:hypothetical protein
MAICKFARDGKHCYIYKCKKLMDTDNISTAEVEDLITIELLFVHTVMSKAT